MRLQDYASKVFHLYIPSNSGVKKAVKKNRILVDGKIGQTGTWVNSGQQLDLLADFSQISKVYELKLNLIFEDEHLAIIIKPAGLTVSGNSFKTVYNALPYNIAPSSEIDALARPTPLHRLDNQTSGILVVAKTKTTQIELGKQFRDNTIQKYYSAIVMGKVCSNSIINIPIENKPATTSFEILAIEPSLKYEHISFLKVSPRTGRTHQIRIHLASIGHPIVGDKLYCDEKTLLKGKGLFLCASEVTFNHPKNLQQLKFEIKTPQKFESYLKREKNRWISHDLKENNAT